MRQRHVKYSALSGTVAAAIALVTTSVSLTASAQPSGPLNTIPLAIVLDPAKDGAQLTVTSTAFANNGKLPLRNTQFAQDESPPLRWTHGPAGTQSYVVLMENTEAHRATPVYLWVVYNVPANVTHLPAHVPDTAELKSPAGAITGLNVHNHVGYQGPHTPKGLTHPYHFEVFALDEKLSLSPEKGAFPAVVEAMKDHVLASGQIVATFAGA